MSKTKNKPTTSGISKSDRDKLKKRIDGFVKKIIKDTKMLGEQVALEIRYWHQSGTNPYRTNATVTDKNKSWNHYKGICQDKSCKTKINSRKKAEFHHEKRGIKNQHAPKNLRPYHKKCHAKKHGG